jgi:hypothetical protein
MAEKGDKLKHDIKSSEKNPDPIFYYLDDLIKEIKEKQTSALKLCEENPDDMHALVNKHKLKILSDHLNNAREDFVKENIIFAGIVVGLIKGKDQIDEVVEEYYKNKHKKRNRKSNQSTEGH